MKFRIFERFVRFLCYFVIMNPLNEVCIKETVKWRFLHKSIYVEWRRVILAKINFYCGKLLVGVPFSFGAALYFVFKIR